MAVVMSSGQKQFAKAEAVTPFLLSRAQYLVAVMLVGIGQSTRQAQSSLENFGFGLIIATGGANLVIDLRSSIAIHLQLKPLQGPVFFEGSLASGLNQI